VDIQLSEQNVR